MKESRDNIWKKGDKWASKNDSSFFLVLQKNGKLPKVLIKMSLDDADSLANFIKPETD